VSPCPTLRGPRASFVDLGAPLCLASLPGLLSRPQLAVPSVPMLCPSPPPAFLRTKRRVSDAGSTEGWGKSTSPHPATPALTRDSLRQSREPCGHCSPFHRTRAAMLHPTHQGAPRLPPVSWVQCWDGASWPPGWQVCDSHPSAPCSSALSPCGGLNPLSSLSAPHTSRTGHRGPAAAETPQLRPPPARPLHPKLHPVPASRNRSGQARVTAQGGHQG
jgi:hypothetical protein